MRLFNKPGLNGTGQESKQRIIEIRDVEQPDRIAVEAELRPGPDLKQFFKGAKATRQGDKTVTQISHFLFSVVHGRSDDEFRQTVVRDFLFCKGAWHHAIDRGSMFKGRVSNRAHQSNAGTTVNKVEAMARYCRTKLFGRIEENRIMAGA